MSLCLSNDAHLTLLLFLLYMSLCSSASTSLCTIFFILPSVSLFSLPSLALHSFLMPTLLFQLSLSPVASCFCFRSTCASCRKGLILGAKQCAMNHKQQLQYYRVRGSYREREIQAVFYNLMSYLYRQYFKSADVKAVPKSRQLNYAAF